MGLLQVDGRRDAKRANSRGITGQIGLRLKFRRSHSGENCLQLVMLWQARHNTEAQHMTIDTNGQMVMKSKQQLKEDFGISAKPIAMFK
ncbi:DUF1315 family protein [Escherichia coli]|uniref:DUF1315 family protein n=1 Tax=Escherichia coli TaxID=562 RepID=UPI00207BD852|nr:DUF1315 family protein [Escherichia coli]